MASLKDRTERAGRACAAPSSARPTDGFGSPVFRSSKHVYAQVIDDTKGETLACASSLEKPMRGSLKTGATFDAAKAVGRLVAERAREKGIKAVMFDRGAYIYHGRIKALADAAREGGLQF